MARSCWVKASGFLGESSAIYLSGAFVYIDHTKRLEPHIRSIAKNISFFVPIAVIAPIHFWQADQYYGYLLFSYLVLILLSPVTALLWAVNPGGRSQPFSHYEMIHNLRHHQSHDNGELGNPSKRRESGDAKVRRRRSSGLKFFASSAHDSEAAPKSQKQWEADYLKNLRNNRPVRPVGSKSLLRPGPRGPTIPEDRAASSLGLRALHDRSPELPQGTMDGRTATTLAHRRAQSDLPTKMPADGQSGLPRAPDPHENPSSQRSPQASAAAHPTQAGKYMEGGLRWMEKQEAKSLRAALEDMDSMEGARLHAAAQADASELVRKHQNGSMKLRQPNRHRNYREHLERGAHARSVSQVLDETNIKARDFQPASGKEGGSHADSNGGQVAGDNDRTPPTDERPAPNQQYHALWDPPERKAYMSMTFPIPLPKSSGRRRSSGPRARDSSGGLFRNPEDKIYEEPQESARQIQWADSVGKKTEAALSTRQRNILSNSVHANRPFSEAQMTANQNMISSYQKDIHKNLPSQSYNPSYTRNEVTEHAANQANSAINLDQQTVDLPNSSLEIRSEELRAATSKRLSDRSSKLISPSLVSQRPDRPIISFGQSHQQQKSLETDAEPNVVILSPDDEVPRSISKASNKPGRVLPAISEPDAPVIFVEDLSAESGDLGTPAPAASNIPAVCCPDEAGNSGHGFDDDDDTRTRRMPVKRPLPSPTSTAPALPRSKTHWSVAQSRATTQCANCALPIAGRIVSAIGQRFHPQCFTCHHCAEALECVAFYPEPEEKRAERLARIHARNSGNWMPEEKVGETANDDGDESLRFYCHLDFHELFSPRCKSCKTPIESEVIVACGSTWHAGHFFCAECGDPFDSQKPFVERNGYAWCVNCHSGRFSGKCKGCRKPVTHQGIQALDAEWHEACFVCSVRPLPQVPACHEPLAFSSSSQTNVGM